MLFVKKSGPALEMRKIVRNLVLVTEFEFQQIPYDCFEMISSVDESEISSGIKVYPNPFNGALNIVSDHVKIESIDVFDFTGKLVGSFDGQGGTDVELSISMRKAGVYLFVFSTNKGVFREKVVCVLD